MISILSETTNHEQMHARLPSVSCRLSIQRSWFSCRTEFLHLTSVKKLISLKPGPWHFFCETQFWCSWPQLLWQLCRQVRDQDILDALSLKLLTTASLTSSNRRSLTFWFSDSWSKFDLTMLWFSDSWSQFAPLTTEIRIALTIKVSSFPS